MPFNFNLHSEIYQKKGPFRVQHKLEYKTNRTTNTNQLLATKLIKIER